MFKNFITRLGKKYFLKKLQEGDFKNEIIRIINQKVDIPKLNEKQERQLLQAMYEAIKIFLIIK